MNALDLLRIREGEDEWVRVRSLRFAGLSTSRRFPVDPVFRPLAGKASLRSLHRTPAKFSLSRSVDSAYIRFPVCFPMSADSSWGAGTYDFSILLSILYDGNDKYEDLGSGRA